ncbi:MAG TPA: HmuY family protein [Nannocystaceae bacterium]|nr:HmuY family protein [Nannocystaceae bacterium]
MTACAPDLEDDLADDDGGAAEGGEQITSTVEGEVVHSTIDATDEAAWVRLDLETRAQVDESDDGWDLAFSRFNVALNGGVSGDGGMEAVLLDGVALDDVTSIPSGPWVTDVADGDDHGDDPDYVTAGWYDYDFATHVLTPRPIVYVVKSVEGNAFALQIVAYYDDAGSSGWLQLRWKPLA